MNEDERKKAMGELAKEVAPAVQEAVAQAITKQVIDDVLAKMPKVQDLSSEEKVARKEQEALALDFFNAVVSKDGAKANQVLKASVELRQKASLNAGTATEGAEFVPEYFSNEIIRIAPQYGIVRQKARHVPLPAKTNYAGFTTVTAHKVAERGRIPTEKFETSSFYLEPEKLACIVPVSSELVKRANIDVVNAILVVAAEAFAKLEDAMGLGLPGSSAGEGLFKKSGVPTHVITGNGFTDIHPDDLLKVTNLIDAGAAGDLEFVMGRTINNTLLLTKDAVTGAYIFGGPQAPQPGAFWGIPKNIVQGMPEISATAQGKRFIGVVNWRYMLFGDTRAYEVKLADQATIVEADGTTRNLFQDDMIALRFIEEIDVDLAEPTKAFATIRTAGSDLGY